MTYRVKRTIKGQVYWYEQSSYRQGDKVKTKSRYLGKEGDKIPKNLFDTPPADPPREIPLNAKISFTKYGINPQELQDSHSRFLTTLHKQGIKTDKMATVKIRYCKAGQKIHVKRRFNNLFVYLPKDTPADKKTDKNYRKAYQKALALASLPLIKQQKPEEYHKIKKRFSRSYRQTQRLINSYILHTNDRDRKYKALVVKWWGLYKPTFGNQSTPEDLGLTDYRRTDWQDEFSSLTAEIIENGYQAVNSRKNHLHDKAQKSAGRQFTAYQNKKAEIRAKYGLLAPFLKWGGWLDKSKKSYKRAVIKADLQEEIAKKVQELSIFI